MSRAENRVEQARQTVSAVFSNGDLDEPAQIELSAVEAAAEKLRELYDAAESDHERRAIAAYAENIAMLAHSLEEAEAD